LGNAHGSTSPLFLVLRIVTAAGAPYTTNERLVAVVLADHMGPQGAWPSIDRLKERTSLGRTSVRDALARLCREPGAVFRLVAKGGAQKGDRYRSARYSLAEGLATRAAHDATGSLAEGLATRAQGVRVASVRGPRRVPEHLSEPPKEPPTVSADADAAPAPFDHMGASNPMEPWPSNWPQRLVTVLAPTGVTSIGKLAGQLVCLKGRFGLADVERALGAWAAAGNRRFGLTSFAENVGYWVGRDGSVRDSSGPGPSLVTGSDIPDGPEEVARLAAERDREMDVLFKRRARSAQSA
jgi:hypothetical protein